MMRSSVHTVFVLLVVAGAADAQVISSVLPIQAARSDRIVIIGTGFGDTQGQVLVGGEPAIVTFWSEARIRAHLPESAALGPQGVQVIAHQPSNTVLVNVLERSGGSGGIRWRTRTDHYYSLARPAVSPDGTIYVTGVAGPLYAIAPDGAVEWVIQGAGGVRPAAVGADGTVYMSGGGGSITAASPEGEILWHYNAPANAGPMFVGPSVGPDGKIYAVTEEEPSLGTDFGAFALAPDGSLAWSTSGGYNFRGAPSGWEVVFGGGRVFFATGQGGPLTGNPGVHALDAASGDEQWLRAGIAKLQADASGHLYWLGAINNNYIGSYRPDGDERWTIVYNEFNGQPGGYVVSPDGSSFYCTSTFTTQAAIESDGTVRWEHRSFTHLLNHFGAAPDGRSFFSVAYPVDNTAPLLRVQDGRDGGVLWEQAVPREDDAWVLPSWEGAYSRDGRTFYLVLHGNNYVDDPYSYLYAIDTSLGLSCVADMDGNGALNVFDFLAFQTLFSEEDAAADLAAPRGVFNVFDFLAFQTAFGEGC